MTAELPRVRGSPTRHRFALAALLIAACVWHAPGEERDLVALLLDRGANPDVELTSESPSGALRQTPLTLALQNASYRIIELLLQRGAYVEAAMEAHGGDGEQHQLPPLCLVLEMGYTDAVHLLLAHGADPNSRAYHWSAASGEEWTPLGLALVQGLRTTARRLLDAGADPDLGYTQYDAEGAYEHSPLAIAARHNDPESAELLLTFGARVQTRTLCTEGLDMFCERPPLEEALLADATEVVRVLLEHGSPVSARELRLASDKGNRSLLTALDERASDAARDAYWRLLLLRRLAAGDLAGSRRLLEQQPGIRVGASSSVLLHYAYGSEELRAFIRERGEPGIATGEPNLLDRLLETSPDPGGAFGVDPTLGDPPVRFPVASSVLHDERIDSRYTADKAFDRDPATCWVEGADGDGIGHRIAFLLPPETAAIAGVPGFGTEQWHAANNRVRLAGFSVYLWTSRYSSFRDVQTHLFKELAYQELGFDDRLELQARDVRVPEPPYRHGPFEQRLVGVLEILEVYRGDRWQDTCIAEIHLYDRNGNEVEAEGR